jgi:hypothetical protein
MDCLTDCADHQQGKSSQGGRGCGGGLLTYVLILACLLTDHHQGKASQEECGGGGGFTQRRRVRSRRGRGP